MTARPKHPGVTRRLQQAVFARLSELLTQRDHGLLTQREFEAELEELGATIPRAVSLLEFALRGGGTRVVIRDQDSGEVLARFEFHRAYCAEV